MITKQDCLILLSEIGATDKIKELLAQPTPSVEIIKFINDNRQLDLVMKRVEELPSSDPDFPYLLQLLCSNFDKFDETPLDSMMNDMNEVIK